LCTQGRQQRPGQQGESTRKPECILDEHQHLLRGFFGSAKKDLKNAEAREKMSVSHCSAPAMLNKMEPYVFFLNKKSASKINEPFLQTLLMETAHVTPYLTSCSDQKGQQ